MLNTVKKKIDKRQIVKLHTLISVVKATDEQYRQTLLINFGVTTCKALTYEQAEWFINALEEKAIEWGVWTKHEGKDRFKNLGIRPGMANPAQLRKIEALWKTASRIRDNKKRAKALRTWLHRHFHVSDLRFLDVEKVKKVIYALEHMAMQKKGEPF